MTLPPRVHNKKTTSVRTKGVDQQKQDRETARGERGEGEEKKLEAIRPAPENPKSKAHPEAKTPSSKRLDKLSRATGALSARKTPMATEAAPAKKKVVQATLTPASFPHPTTQRRQRLKASDFKSEPRWDFEEEYSLDAGSLQTVSLILAMILHYATQAAISACAQPDTWYGPTLPSHNSQSQGGEGRSRIKVWTTQKGVPGKGFVWEPLKKTWGRPTFCEKRVWPGLGFSTWD